MPEYAGLLQNGQDGFADARRCQRLRRDGFPPRNCRFTLSIVCYFPATNIPMTDPYFDVASLAAYLHITPSQVEKLAKRDKLPFRRVNGKIQFPRAEIHHWMEERMGVLDDHELAAVEGRLEREHVAATPEGTDVEVAQWLSVTSIAVPLAARTRRSAISSMSELAASTGILWDAEKMTAAVTAREELQSTALDNGVALLHPRRPQAAILGDNLLALGITGQGIPFGGSRTLTDIFFLVCSMDDRSHLRVLARIARLIASEALLESIRLAGNATLVYESICEAESNLN